MPLTVDLTSLRRTVTAVARLKRKPEAEVLNKALTTAIIGSSTGEGLVQMTPKVTPGRVRSDLRRNKLAIRMVTAKLKRTGYFAAKHSRAEIQQRIQGDSDKLLKARLKSRGYIVAGWLKSLQGLGVLKKRAGAQSWEGGTAAMSKGIPATAQKLVAQAINMARGSRTITEPLVQAAFNNAERDARVYYERKMSEVYRRAGCGN